MKKCKCVSLFHMDSKLSFILALVLCAALVFFFYHPKSNVIVLDRPAIPPPPPSSLSSLIPSFPLIPPTRDVLLNPYTPPLRDERYYVPEMGLGYPIPMGRVPINVSTNIGAVNTNYRQVGILTPANGSPDDKILPLMGRPLYTNRGKWQYYTISNQFNNVKLPVMVKKRRGTDEYGVDELSEGDYITVQGLKQKFKVTVYDDDGMQYLPYL